MRRTTLPERERFVKQRASRESAKHRGALLHARSRIGFLSARKEEQTAYPTLPISIPRIRDEAILASLSRASRAKLLTELQINAAHIQMIVLSK